MITGIDLNATVDFVAKKDKKNPTIWKLSAVPSSVSGQSAMAVTWADRIKLVQVSLKGWSNFKVGEKEIPFEVIKQNMFGAERDIVPLHLVDLIPPMIITEIMARIYEISQLTDDDTKN